MGDSRGCECGSAPKLIFACSGAADVGALADRAARQMTADGVGAMFCLAGIGGRVSGIMKTTEAAGGILVIDGCPLDCAKKTIEKAGFSNFHHIRVTDLGLEKGRTSVDDQSLAKVVGAARGLVAAWR